MPEVISLLSSTPPPPADPREVSSIRRPHCTPPAPAELSSFPFSDDIDFARADFDNDVDLGKPVKRRRLTPEIGKTAKPPGSSENALPSQSRDSLFLFSDDILLSDGSLNGQTQSKPPVITLDSDPIVFTSSAPEPSRRSPSRRNKQQATRALVDDDIDNGITSHKGKEPQTLRKDNIEDFSDPLALSDPSGLFDFQETEFKAPPLRSEFSDKTATLLASLNRPNTDSTSTLTGKKKQSRFESIDEDPDELPESRPSRRPQKAIASKQSSADKEAKAKGREAAKAQRELERQLEKERKQKQKEEKAKDKQLAADIAQANRLKVEKKNSTPEMILDLASSFRETSVGNQAAEYMRMLGVEQTFFDSSIRNVVRWRRKMKAIYNKSLGYWEPCELHLREEEHVLCLVTAQEFVDMVTSSLHSDNPNASSELDSHILRLKRAYPHCTIIYLIEGLSAWMRKNANSRNRVYQAEFRRNLDEVQGLSQPTTSTSTTRRKKTNKPETTPIDDDMIEDALLNLQINHNCLIHQTTSPPESAEWIKIFTEHISTVPYRRERMNDNDSAFCMDSGQVKPGENASDTYIRMLQEISRVTASMAYGVVNQYPSVVDLVKGMRRSGPGMLEDVKKSANKDGALTDARIGPAASRRLYKVFMGMDPQSTDI
ncbi:ERCC4 domain-containing protein [Aspergillus spinulosporus]